MVLRDMARTAFSIFSRDDIRVSGIDNLNFTKNLLVDVGVLLEVNDLPEIDGRDSDHEGQVRDGEVGSRRVLGLSQEMVQVGQSLVQLLQKFWVFRGSAEYLGVLKG